MVAFLILLAAACVAISLDALTTNRGIVRGARETSWILGAIPSPLQVWFINIAQVAAAGAVASLAALRVWPWSACDIFPALLVLAHGFAAWHNWPQAFPKK